jgi:hypothetical protein
MQQNNKFATMVSWIAREKGYTIAIRIKNNATQ